MYAATRSKKGTMEAARGFYSVQCIKIDAALKLPASSSLQPYVLTVLIIDDITRPGGQSPHDSQHKLPLGHGK